AFHVFWRDPGLLERAIALVVPRPASTQHPDMSRRVAKAMDAASSGAARDAHQQDDRRDEDEASETWSPQEILQEKDFDKMAANDIRAARERIRSMRLPVMALPTRRWRPDSSGARADMRATLRATLRTGGAVISLRRRRRRRRHPPLVVLCDISGSMDRYSRMFLHFMHAITNDRDRVHTFLFGTRLTNISRYLRYRDIDVALDKISRAVEDWAGGTRIGQCLHDFNRDWSRRVLAQGAIVLFISDGLDRDAGAGLGAEMQRLHLSCRRLVWLNPLLRYEAFEPKSIGIRAIMPHVDEFRPIHNLESLRTLVETLARPQPRRQEGMARWREMIP
ncbi:MAG: VWA domain-containing protein, partial [Rhodospirillales bacterium]